MLDRVDLGPALPHDRRAALAGREVGRVRRDLGRAGQVDPHEHHPGVGRGRTDANLDLGARVERHAAKRALPLDGALVAGHAVRRGGRASVGFVSACPGWRAAGSNPGSRAPERRGRAGRGRRRPASGAGYHGRAPAGALCSAATGLHEARDVERVARVEDGAGRDVRDEASRAVAQVEAVLHEVEHDGEALLLGDLADRALDLLVEALEGVAVGRVGLGDLHLEVELRQDLLAGVVGLELATARVGLRHEHDLLAHLAHLLLLGVGVLLDRLLLREVVRLDDLLAAARRSRAGRRCRRPRCDPRPWRRGRRRRHRGRGGDRSPRSGRRGTGRGSFDGAWRPPGTARAVRSGRLSGTIEGLPRILPPLGDTPVTEPDASAR